MGRKRCRKCGTSLRSNATACPHCGATRRGKVLLVSLLLISLVALAGASFYADTRNGIVTRQPPKQRAPIKLALPEPAGPRALPGPQSQPALSLVSTTPEYGSKTRPQSAAPAAGASLYVTARILNLRREPGTNAPIVSKLPRGRQLKEVSRKDQWLEVSVPSDGMAGWVHSAFVNAAPE